MNPADQIRSFEHVGECWYRVTPAEAEPEKAPMPGVPRIERSTPKPTTEELRARWPGLLDNEYMKRGIPRRQP